MTKNKISLYSYVGLRRADADLIINTVASILGVSKEDILSKTRKREIVEARQLTQYFIRTTCPKLSLEAIGQATGGKDHATVIHSCKSVANLLDTDKKFAIKFDKIHDELKNVDRFSDLENLSDIEDSDTEKKKELTIGEFYDEMITEKIKNKYKNIIN